MGGPPIAGLARSYAGGRGVVEGRVIRGHDDAAVISRNAAVGSPARQEIRDGFVGFGTGYSGPEADEPVETR
ncbi:hypothetical protein A5N15_04155 [Rothia kristinae]|uniref:Uncharacterized protein n=1 Tax=Rothia kristinae TaxID=37923 RepID=A0A657IV75_9MICC|nr:hypothetical protein A5N15_04155 [Rothia kristinae]